jgi:hypothetical protein
MHVCVRFHRSLSFYSTPHTLNLEFPALSLLEKPGKNHVRENILNSDVFWDT